MNIRILIFSLLLVVISACGFHLREMAKLPPQMKVLYVDTMFPNTPFALLLKQQLRANGVRVVEAANLAPYTLEIIENTFNKRLMVMSASARVRNYLLTGVATYQIRDRTGKVIYGPRKAKSTTTSTTNNNQLLGDNDLLQQQRQMLMLSEINQIFLQLSSQDAAQAFLIPMS